MRPILNACLILLLLTVDWAWDPFCGTCPWSQQWGSTEAVCPSTMYRLDMVRACDPDPYSNLLALPSADILLPEASLPTPPPDRPTSPFATAPVYALMTIRR
jgi:hypothetical protein